MAGWQELYNFQMRLVFLIQVFVFIFQGLNFLLQQCYFTLLEFGLVFQAFP